MKQTPEEKAVHLRGFYYMIFPHESEAAIKQAAMMCVDEIIKANPIKRRSSGIINGVATIYKDDNTAYWQQVKQELQKM